MDGCKDEAVLATSLTVDPFVVKVYSKLKREHPSSPVSAKEHLPDEELRDPAFLDAVQSSVNKWISDIGRVIKLQHDRLTSPAGGKLSDTGSVAVMEVKFFIAVEATLLSVRQQLEDPMVQFALEALRIGRRFLSTVSFEAHVELPDNLELAQSSLLLLRDLPIHALLNATTIEGISHAVTGLFNHIRRTLRKARRYPVYRAAVLMEDVSRDLLVQLNKVLHPKGDSTIMQLPYAEFELLTGSCRELCAQWADSARQFKQQLRDELKHRSGQSAERVPAKMRFAHEPLQDRISELRQFRKQHEQFVQTLDKVFTQVSRQGSASATSNATAAATATRNAVVAAYDKVLAVDVVDTTPTGTDAWDRAKQEYADLITRAESLIISNMRDTLGNAATTKDMFHAFSKFNPLFFRLRIRSAVLEYQNALLSKVKVDIFDLQEAFKKGFEGSGTETMLLQRGIPSLSAKIMWARQISRRLTTLINQVASVLGPTWDKHIDGQRIKEECDFFAKKLDTSRLFEAWVKNARGVSIDWGARVLAVHRARNGNLALKMNFDPDILDLCQELGYLESLHFQIPFAVKVKGEEIRKIYPLSVTLRECAETYMSLGNRLSQQPQVSSLLASYHAKVQEALASACDVGWDDIEGVYSYTAELSDLVFPFQDRWTEVLRMVNRIEDLLDDQLPCLHMIDGPLYQANSGDFLQTHKSTFISAGTIDQQQQGQGSTNSFVDQVLAIFGKVQKIVDDLNLAGCSNLRAYVSDLNARLEARLHMELSAVVGIWVDEFNDWPRNGTRVIPEDSITIHELLMLQDGPSTRLVLKPSIEEARAGLMKRLSVLLAKLCHFPRIRHGRYDNVTTSGKDGANENERGVSSSFMDLVSNYPNDQVLSQAYEAIDSTVCRMAKYVYDWQKYEALWRAEPSALFNELGDDIEAWQQLLSEIRIARTAVDATRDTEAFGPVAIDFSPIQEQVLHKYDQWQREVLQAFAMQMADQTRSMLSQLEKARGSLERQTLAVTSCREIAEFVTCVREAQGNAGKAWAQRVVSLRAGERLLERQRYAFPRDWVWTDRVEGEWTALEQVLNRRVKLLEESKDKVEHMIAFHDTKVMEQIDSLYEEWGTMRSHQTVGASTESPTRALQTISVFDSRLQKVQADLSQVIKAKLVLDLDCSNQRRLDPLREDVSNLRAVWEGLGGVHHKLSDISDTPWPAVVPKKVKNSLEQLLEELAQLPDALRQYDAYDDLRTRVNAALSLHPMIADLKSEALKDRHWKQILLILSLGTLSNGVNGLLLGQLWESSAMREREKELRGLMSEAAGELALEEFISSVKDYWTTLNLDLIPYGGGKCHLVKGWEDLFAQLDEHIGSLDAMKHSPHYKVFEADTIAWGDRLTKLRLLLDIWVDVQRRYVYLEGIFCHSEDIRTLLPTESSRFGSVDAEYVSIMKKVFDTKVSILDIMTTEYSNNTMKTLERLGRTLTRIQKALGDYLEMQRAQFPRFYFVGDEDLLEMIGNSQDLAIITQHVNKMFAGISGLETCTDEHDANIVWITAFRSKESEIVELGDNHKIPIDVSIDGTGVADQPEGQGRRRGIHYILTSIETAMRKRLPELLTKAMEPSLTIIDLAERFPAQVALLASQARWCNAQSAALGIDGGSAAVAEDCKAELEALSAAGGAVQGDPLLRRKYEQLISEVIHQREMSRHLDNEGITSSQHFEWLRILKHRWYPNEMRLDVEICNAVFEYGFEYLGVCDKLVQTPLTDRCYMALTQTLDMRLGGNPFGPAVSQQIFTIQSGLRHRRDEIAILDRPVSLSPNVGIFVTTNPGQVAMIVPDKILIAQVLLFSQGFKQAEVLSSRVVALFDRCLAELSKQPHYDFGLRALKSVLASAGSLMRYSSTLQQANNAGLPEKEEQLVDRVEVTEDTMILKAVANAVVPKLVGEDVTKMSKLVGEVFPETQAVAFDEASLRLHIVDVCQERGLDPADPFIDKCLQLYQLQKLNHGIILFGPVGSGKSAVTAVLSEALQRHERIVTKLYVLEPKAMMKDDLYGRLDPTTREWTDGVFTDILRKIIVQNSAAMPPPSHDNSNREHVQEGKMQQEHPNSAITLLRHYWIVFDGDVDPNWAENLNSVLDDNKMLTLPSGERLLLPPSVRILFEVDSLKYATMATVSRCGMIWFSPETVTDEMICLRELKGLSSARMLPFLPAGGRLGDSQGDSREGCVDTLLRFFHPGGLVCRSLSYVKELPATTHIMPFTSTRGINAMFSLLSHYVDQAITSCRNASIREKYLDKALILSVCWGFGSSLPLSDREQFARFVASEAEACGVPVPVNSTSSSCLLDYEVRVMDGEWAPWTNKVRSVDLDASQVLDADLVIPTIDTERHSQCINAWIASRRHFILCGPPGSGKSMTLLSALRALGDTLDVVSLNFSSESTQELLMRTLMMYCECCQTSTGWRLRPSGGTAGTSDKWLVVFCDEINLPVPDDYGTQRVIMFIRQIIEAQGFYRPSDRSWVEVERILFVGACNPSSDAGRHAMSDRFLRHVPVLFMDYPSTQSLLQIYGTFARAMLRLQPQLQEYADMLTRAMVSVYTKIGQTFTVVGSGQPHYFYSPRELTRWKIALYEAMGEYDCMSRVELIRLFVHEAMRVFRDRLTTSEERGSADGIIDDAAKECFGATDRELRRPLMFSHYGSKYYTEIGIERLRVFVGAKLEEFYEESLSVKLSVFDTMLDHMTRIDRVLRQPLGHMLLVGASGVGKTVLSKFVSWMNGLSVYQLKVGKSYDLHSFEADLRHVMKRAGVKEEKICFVFDESNVLGPAFLERMNALLAGGEVPGLFEGDEYQILIQDCRTISEAANTADANELFANFTKQVQRNLHIVFTMNPANPDFHNRKATSPALFNRCVVNWVGDWPTDALLQIAHDSLTRLDLPDNCFVSDDAGKHKPRATMDIEERAISVATSMVCIHESVVKLHDSLRALNKRFAYVTPRDYMDFLRHFEALYSTKRAEWAEQQRHLNLGLEKLHQTGQQVAEMKTQLSSKTELLAEKNKLAEAKMAQMVKGQSEAEQRKRESQSLREKLSEDHQLAASRQEEVARELAEVEPALNHARQLVQAIQRKQVDEMRSLPNPPAPVKITLEAVVCLIRNYGPGVELTWDHIRKELKDPQLMVTVLQFNTDALSVAARERVEGYLKSSAWDMERIERASRAAGPLAQWVKSQISYGKMLQSIGPLRAEVAELEAQQKVSSEKLRANSELLEKLEREIEQYKDEYAQLISEGQSIRVEMEEVSAMCKRSSDLLASLASEKDRWEMQKETYRTQSGTIIGDTVLGAAFCTYSGFCEHAYREQLHKEWYRIFDSTDNGPKINSSLSLIEYLSKPGQRLAWIANQLPNDDLSIQNAIIIDKYIRYPMIVDPSGQAVTFLHNQHTLSSSRSQGKLKVTSFSDPAFTKHLEAALRFGTALLVTDVQKVDPIINTVLNREIYKKGGRTLITVGDLDVDYSPNFSMFMTTRDAALTFTPDVASRVTMVNFNVTKESLQAQCLHALLKSERPDVEEKRVKALKLQGEFRVRIRELEDGLLHALSNVTGSILEDEAIVSTLETLKCEAAEVAEEASKADVNLREIDAVSSAYIPLSTSAANLFFVVQSLSALSNLYQFGLVRYLELYNVVVLQEQQQSSSQSITGAPTSRLRVIWQRLVRLVYDYVGSGLLAADRLIFLLRVAEIGSSMSSSTPPPSGYMQLLSMSMEENDEKPLSPPECTKSINSDHDQKNVIARLLSAAAFAGASSFAASLESSIENDPQGWTAFLSSTAADTTNSIPQDGWQQSKDRVLASLENVIISRWMRPDLVEGYLERYADVTLALDPPLTSSFNTPSLQDSIMSESLMPNTTLYILACTSGFDPSLRIVDLAERLGIQLETVAMGSPEGYSLADRAVAVASKQQGRWALLTNMHLCLAYFRTMDRKIPTQTHNQFKLFITIDVGACTGQALPETLMKSGRILMLEAPTGVRSSLMRSYAEVLVPERVKRGPVERNRLHFLLAWLHAIVLERVRYAPVGWTKEFDFSEADLSCAVELTDKWLDEAVEASSSSTDSTTRRELINIDPAKIPWDAIRTTLIDVVYGGRLDNHADRKALTSIVEYLFSPEAFHKNFLLNPNSEPVDKDGALLHLPDARKREDFVALIDTLFAGKPTPRWVGLQPEVENFLRARRASRCLTEWLQLRS
ncbi:hypothetical protein FOZ61_008250 [Perkinsus olseni]|uniref:AAA+ ATPase domain-containing protein n=1 Tax=Perkinsus olseni TaxID=32597 RepID=A0A7J6L5J5_PEROL|nr:hypothetical protein FOZ61_008250 [Perkinsus olseni]